MKWFYNTVRFLFGWIVRAVYPVKIVGDKKSIPKNGKVIVLSNHITFREVPAIVAYIPGYRHFLAKKELSEKRIPNWFFVNMGAFYVDRGKVDLKTIKTGLNYLKEGEGLAIFPEGTRNRNGEDLQEVKGGAALFAIKGQAPVIPLIWHSRIRPFRRNYLYVGEPIDLSEFYKGRADSVTVAAAASLIESRMKEDKDFIDDYVINKRWKNKKKQLEGKKD